MPVRQIKVNVSCFDYWLYPCLQPCYRYYLFHVFNHWTPTLFSTVGLCYALDVTEINSGALNRRQCLTCEKFSSTVWVKHRLIPAPCIIVVACSMYYPWLYESPTGESRGYPCPQQCLFPTCIVRAGMPKTWGQLYYYLQSDTYIHSDSICSQPQLFQDAFIGC